MKKDLSSSNSESQLLSPDKVAERLNISPTYANTLMERGLIPTVRTDKGIFVRKSDIDDGLICKHNNGVLDKDGNPLIWTVFRPSRKRNNSH